MTMEVSLGLGQKEKGLWGDGGITVGQLALQVVAGKRLKVFFSQLTP